MYVVQEKFTEHHYEHVECPEKFTSLIRIIIKIYDYPLNPNTS